MCCTIAPKVGNVIVEPSGIVQVTAGTSARWPRCSFAHAATCWPKAAESSAAKALSAGPATTAPTAATSAKRRIQFLIASTFLEVHRTYANSHQAPGWYRMSVGDFEVTALLDGTLALPTDQLLTNTTPEKVQRALER